MKNKAREFFLVVVVSIFIIEAAIMLLFHYFISVETTPLLETFLDGLLLVIFLSPILYLFSFRPLSRELNAHIQLTEELKKAGKELGELDRMRNEFINMASHELRTPIAIIKEGITQLSEGMSGEIGQGQKRLAGITLRNINRLVRVVDNIFEVSEIEFEKPAPKKEVVDIAGIVREVTADFASQAREKGLEIRQSLPDGEVRVYAEKKAIHRVLANLVSNAVKFTNKGFIEVKLLEKSGEIECSIIDTGIGITPENLPKVFDKFQQFNRSFGPGERGTGLSLAIARGIVELHKGKIWAESRLGEGSKFSFSLPK